MKCETLFYKTIIYIILYIIFIFWFTDTLIRLKKMSIKMLSGLYWYVLPPIHLTLLQITLILFYRLYYQFYRNAIGFFFRGSNMNIEFWPNSYRNACKGIMIAFYFSRLQRVVLSFPSPLNDVYAVDSSQSNLYFGPRCH